MQGHKRTGYFLGLDTSGKRLSVALMSPDGRFKRKSHAGINQENHLFTLADGLMRPHRLALEDLEAVCVLRGPGRFTGIRVGLTFASVLNRLAGVRAVGVSTLEVLAYQAAGSAGFKKFMSDRKHRDIPPEEVCPFIRSYIVSILHAFRDEYYCQIFRPVPGSADGTELVRPAQRPRWLDVESLSDYLKSLPARLYCAGRALPQTGIFPAGGPLQSGAVVFYDCGIRPESIISAGLAGRENDLSPIYLKPARYELERSVKKPAHKP